ncbi:unnamed protein product [Rodentolepis nana]|uniref:Helicase ATP-binding domain-containing protein n=1 Tax=Rodentolepis nana TaxID=102285 RepID=A0A0R3TVR9_RODNA|nr:unnamed protein product [Rodentolepis nana]
MEPRNGSIALVIVTTKELAQKVEFFPKHFRLNCIFRVACLHSGATTPGRLLDFLESGYVHLRHTT